MMYRTTKLFVIAAFLAVAIPALADDVDDLIAALTGDDNEARMIAAKNAGTVGPSAIERVGILVAAQDYLTARASRLALERIVAAAGAPGAEDQRLAARELLNLSDSIHHSITRREAIRLMGWIGGRENAAALGELLTDPEIADSARMALQRIPGEEVVAALLAAAPNVDDAVQPGIFYAVAQRGSEDAIPLLIKAARSDNPEKSWMAFDVLTRSGVAPMDIIPRTHAKDLADRKRYASGFLRAADVQLGQGKRANAEKMYASIAAFPVSPQHACAALIGLKNSQSPKLIEHALGYLLESGIRDVAERTLIEAEIEEIDDYLMRAYGVTNAAKQRVLLKVLAARKPEGVERFLNEARHNESPMVRFTAANALGNVPAPDAFEAAFASAPPFERDEMSRTYFKMTVAEQRAGHTDGARVMAESLVGPAIDSRIREGAFGIIEAVASAESAPVLRELIGAAYQTKNEAEDPYDGIRGLAIAAGRAYVAVHAAAAKDDPTAIDEVANVSENAFHAEVSNYAEERLKEILGEALKVSEVLEPYIDDLGYFN